MSLLVKTAKVFSGLGAVATVPYATTFVKKHIEAKHSGGDRIIKVVEPVKPQGEEKDISKTEVMNEVKKMMEQEGQKTGATSKPSCFWLPKHNGLELLMCVYKEKLDAPVLFHYDVRKHYGQAKSVRQVENIIFTSGPSTMKFKNGATVEITKFSGLKLYLTTQFRKRNVTVIPEHHCSIEATGGRDHKLYCSDSSGLPKNKTLIGNVELSELHQNNHKTLNQ